jgi:hypothetical protein
VRYNLNQQVKELLVPSKGVGEGKYWSKKGVGEGKYWSKR